MNYSQLPQYCSDFTYLFNMQHHQTPSLLFITFYNLATFVKYNIYVWLVVSEGQSTLKSPCAFEQVHLVLHFLFILFVLTRHLLFVHRD